MERQAQPNTNYRWTRTLTKLLMSIVLLTSVAGCKQFIVLSYLLGGPPSIEPQYDAQTGKSMTDHGVVVAVVCFADNDLKYNHDSIDMYVEAGIAAHLAQHQIVTIDPQRVRSWLSEITRTGIGQRKSEPASPTGTRKIRNTRRTSSTSTCWTTASTKRTARTCTEAARKPLSACSRWIRPEAAKAPRPSPKNCDRSTHG